MKKSKYIDEEKLKCDDVTTGIVKVIGFKNNKKITERIIDSKDDSIYFIVEQMEDRGYEVKIYHQILT